MLKTTLITLFASAAALAMPVLAKAQEPNAGKAETAPTPASVSLAPHPSPR